MKLEKTRVSRGALTAGPVLRPEITAQLQPACAALANAGVMAAIAAERLGRLLDGTQGGEQ
jgi:hypothetical protein